MNSRASQLKAEADPIARNRAHPSAQSAAAALSHGFNTTPVASPLNPRREAAQPLSSNAVLQLQQAHGNQHVLRRLTIQRSIVQRDNGDEEQNYTPAQPQVDTNTNDGGASPYAPTVENVGLPPTVENATPSADNGDGGAGGAPASAPSVDNGGGGAGGAPASAPSVDNGGGGAGGAPSGGTGAEGASADGSTPVMTPSKPITEDDLKLLTTVACDVAGATPVATAAGVVCIIKDAAFAAYDYQRGDMDAVGGDMASIAVDGVGMIPGGRAAKVFAAASTAVDVNTKDGVSGNVYNVMKEIHGKPGTTGGVDGASGSSGVSTTAGNDGAGGAPGYRRPKDDGTGGAGGS